VFARSDFAALADRLGTIAGRFLLSVNDVPETRAAFGCFGVEELRTRYTVAGGAWSDVAEILVAGPGSEIVSPRDLLSL